MEVTVPKERFLMTDFIKFMEIVGTVAFAVSGALVAIDANLDLFGVVFVSCITAVGGGILRDMLLGIHPPFIFLNYRLCLLAIGVALFVFMIAYFKKMAFQKFRHRVESINNLFDALGLAAFTVTGAEVVYTQGYGDNGFLVVAIGMITAVGGGIFRDIITNTTPYVFKKHIYALASILGGILYHACRSCAFSEGWTITLSISLVIVIRLFATKYRWSLPKVHIEK